MNQQALPAAEQALSAAYGELRRGLLATIRHKVRDAQVAEDLLQDVFVKAVLAVRQRRAPGNLPAWLHQVVRTTVIDHYRARRIDEQPLDDEPAAEEPEDLAAFQSLATCMQPLAGTLPVLYRDALLAADFQGQRLAVIAADSDVTVSAIKSRVSRARAMLRDRLLACCAVAKDSDGRVADFRPRAGAGCGCGGCGTDKP
jgi:RNA polymerase sigma-70 factor (ECF subfamily)